MLKKLHKSALLIIIAIALLFVAHPKSSAYSVPVETIRIGLFYGSNELSSSNLAIRYGSGYRFGWYNSSREFVPIASTSETQITMMKDKNMYLTWSSTYTDEKPSSYAGAVGCYHILLDRLPADYAEACELASQFSGGFVGYYNGTWRVCVGSYESAAAAEDAIVERDFIGSAFSASSSCIVVVKTGTTNILFEFDCGSSSNFAVQPADVVDPDTGEVTTRAQAWCKGRSYYGGFQYTRLSGNDITVVNFVGLEDYIKGVVPYESGATWPIEALKAQALCARTYAVRNLGNHSSRGFDLCNTTDCQVYFGTNGATDVSDRAVEETAGKFVVYNGELCDTVYHSSDGGATEDSENVFYSALPYLRGVVDPYESTVNTGYSSWSYTYTADDITWILQNKGYNCAQIVSVTPTYTRMGNIYSLKFKDENGKTFTFSRSSAGSILYSSTLKKYTHSQRFTIDIANDNGIQLYVNDANNPVNSNELYAIGSSGTQAIGSAGSYYVLTGSGAEEIEVRNSGPELIADAYVVSGSGWGHNVGMSQYGALAMANLGFTCEEIIKFYFTGVSIE